MSYRTHHVEGSGESKRRRLGGDEVGEMESKGDRLDDYDVRAESAIRNNESLPQLQFPQGICTVGKGTTLAFLNSTHVCALVMEIFAKHGWMSTDRLCA